MMRRGPDGPRTLCNACGLMWANKGMLRDLTKSPVPLQAVQSAPVIDGGVSCFFYSLDMFLIYFGKGISLVGSCPIS
uniref:GATA-type domain-containing protein n=1 Tax=Arundo donax TaxID=35708 RepID=A0A0A9F348_ARUDO